MEAEKKLSLLQNTYAAALAETANTYARLNVLEHVVAAKAERQTQTAETMLGMMGITSADQVFTSLADVFGCADWRTEPTEKGLVATAKACKLCALSKRMGGANPCHGWCLDPMAALIAKLTGHTPGDGSFNVRRTLMDSDACEVEVVL